MIPEELLIGILCIGLGLVIVKNAATLFDFVAGSICVFIGVSFLLNVLYYLIITGKDGGVAR